LDGAGLSALTLLCQKQPVFALMADKGKIRLKPGWKPP